MRFISDLVMTADLVTFAGSSDNNYVLRLVQETVRLGYRWVWFHDYRIHTCSNKQCFFNLLTHGFKVLFKVSRFY